MVIRDEPYETLLLCRSHAGAATLRDGQHVRLEDEDGTVAEVIVHLVSRDYLDAMMENQDFGLLCCEQDEQRVSLDELRALLERGDDSEDETWREPGEAS